MTNWTYIEELRDMRERNEIVIENHDKVIKVIDESNFFLQIIHSRKRNNAKYAQIALLRKNIEITDEILLILRTAQFVMVNHE